MAAAIFQSDGVKAGENGDVNATTANDVIASMNTNVSIAIFKERRHTPECSVRMLSP